MNKILLPATLVVLVLAGCASSSSGGNDKVGQAVTTPLSDLNVVRAEIPPALAAAQRAPYELPADRSCTALAAQVRALDDALGADVDAPADKPSLIDRGSDAATGALRRTVEGAIPFRGWIRQLSGAERYSREVMAAIAAGTVRRGFIKGIAAAGNCPRQAPN
jgi:hypothetical protein